MVPALVLLGTVVAAGLFLFSSTALFQDNAFSAAAEYSRSWQQGQQLFLMSSLLPLLSYVSFVLLTLVLDVTRAILAVPTLLGRDRDDRG